MQPVRCWSQDVTMLVEWAAHSCMTATEVWPERGVPRAWMESPCVMVRENAGELVDSARLSWARKCGETAAGVVRGSWQGLYDADAQRPTMSTNQAEYYRGLEVASAALRHDQGPSRGVPGPGLLPRAVELAATGEPSGMANEGLSRGPG